MEFTQSLVQLLQIRLIDVHRPVDKFCSQPVENLIKAIHLLKDTCLIMTASVFVTHSWLNEPTLERGTSHSYDTPSPGICIFWVSSMLSRLLQWRDDDYCPHPCLTLLRLWAEVTKLRLPSYFYIWYGAGPLKCCDFYSWKRFPTAVRGRMLFQCFTLSFDPHPWSFFSSTDLWGWLTFSTS